MEIDTGYKERISGTIRSVGGNEAASLIIGKSVKSVERYRAGHEMTFKDAVQLAKAAGVSPIWLATGEGSPNSDTPAALLPKGDDMEQVPVLNLSASAGHGATAIHEEVVDHIALGNRVVRELGLQKGQLFLMPALGDSMEPRIMSGELMLCSRAEQHLRGVDGTYVVRLEGDILVKRIQRIPGNKVVVSSLNTGYAPFEVTLNDGTDFAILGLVVLVLRRV